MKRKITLILLFILFAGQGYPQYDLKENAIWVFGDWTGLDFNSGTPVPINTHVWGFGEANASVCNQDGKLLFYTNGTSVWDSTHELMPTGYNLTGMVSPSPVISPPPATESAAQGALITSVPGEPYLYYIFSLSSWEWGDRAGRLYYSTVDMRLNGGRGDIISNQKGVFISGGYTEHMIAVPGDNCNIWVLVHRSDSARFDAYEITANGINRTPVLSRTGQHGIAMSVNRNRFWATGTMSASPDNKKIAGAYYYGGLLELYDFDPATGLLSNARILDQANSDSYYGTCFSPDNSRLYAGNTNRDSLYQYDVSLSSTVAIAQSKTGVGLYTNITTLRLAPDRKIYFQSFPGNLRDLSAIEYPDLGGPACQYNPIAASIFFGSPRAGNIRHINPPAIFVKALSADTTVSVSDTLICGPFERLTLRGKNDEDIYNWDDGSRNSTRTIREWGMYHVTSQKENSCHIRIDSFLVRGSDIQINIGNDTFICDNLENPLLLSASTPGATYLWQDGSTTPVYYAEKDGFYYVTVHKEGCTASDTITIRQVSMNAYLGPDQTLCMSEPVSVILTPHTLPEGAEILWSNGTGDRSLLVTDTGTYWIQIRSDMCFADDTVNIHTERCTCSIEIPTAFTPNGDGKNDRFRPLIEPGCPVSRMELSVFNRWGKMVWHSADPVAAWDGSYNGAAAETGTYMYLLKFTGGTHQKETIRKGDLTLIR